MSTQEEVEVSYDVGNDFFKLWLDEKMNYTCALFDGTDDLEEAQLKKLARLSQFAGIDASTQRVLDIGCGWGANLEYQATVNNVPDCHGITLSSAQREYGLDRKIPNATISLCNYLDYEPAELFDAVMSICMIEHVATPEETRAGKHIGLYREYFRRAWEWTKPGARFGLQTITRNKVPRTRQDLDDLRHTTYIIFPGGITPRVEDIVVASQPYWEVMDLRSMRLDYKRTIEHWRMRLRDHEGVIRAKWGDVVFDDYDRYLTTCVKAFDQDWHSLHQWSLRRKDDL
jgi:cyclopropane-fatty-acyl-phospholipid synthase